MIDSLIQGKLHTKAQRHTSHPHPATAPGFLFLVVPEFREHSARARGVRQTLSFMRC